MTATTAGLAFWEKLLHGLLNAPAARRLEPPIATTFPAGAFLKEEMTDVALTLGTVLFSMNGRLLKPSRETWTRTRLSSARRVATPTRRTKSSTRIFPCALNLTCGTGPTLFALLSTRIVTRIAVGLKGETTGCNLSRVRESLKRMVALSLTTEVSYVNAARVFSLMHLLQTFFAACGVCSNANDLAVMMDLRNSFDKISDFCAAEFVDADVTAASPVQGGLTYECYKGLGFTDQCAFIHASTDIAGRNCTLPCRAALADPDVTGTSTSCELTACASCQQSFRMQNGVDVHLKWAGRDLWSSEIISYNPFYHLKRPCSDWEETEGSILTQDPYAQGNKAESISQSGSQSADRFDPSYSIVRHSETCRYEVRFSMKHDKTLPNAGGWNPVYPQGVDRQEFERLCNRDSKEIAEDGLPYNVPREFTFTFGDDVREVTGIFDHVAIVYNPCGIDVQGLNRPHYDFRMFTVSESWREIMQCDVTPCDPSTCIFDGTFQTSDSGKAFFETDTCYEDPGIPDPLAEPGSFNKNMPFGFFTLANMANPRSGTTSMNLFTNLDWNETTVDSWSDPLFTMRSFAGLVTGFEPKIPAEFLQGTEEKEYTSPETSNTCQTLFNLPSASSASYNPDTGFTTLSFSGISPSCACGPETNTSLTEGDCEVLEADLKSYDAVYERFAGQPPPEPQDNKTAFGKFSVADVESAFGLVPGSLWISGTEEFDCLSSSNFWTDYVGKNSGYALIPR